MNNPMIAVWFSCGAASAVAAKKTIARYLYPKYRSRMIKRGQQVIVRRYPDNGVLKARDEYANVLCISDGYVMLRHKGAMPFLMSLKDVQKLNQSTDGSSNG